MDKRGFLACLGLSFFLTLLVSPLYGQEGSVKDDLRKIVSTAKGQLSEAVTKLLDSGAENFTVELEKLFEQRLSERVKKLEEAIVARDKRIAELEAKLKEVSQPKPSPLPAGPKAFLGVHHVDVPQEVRAVLKIENGALVTHVVEGSPAAGAGLTAGDVIVAVNDKSTSSVDLGPTIASMKPDQDVSLTYFHDGQKATKTVKLGDRDKFVAAQLKPQPPPPEKKKEPVVLGISIRARDGGIFVEEVEQSFTGSTAGLVKNDKLTQVNGKDMKTVDEVAEALGKIMEGDKLTLTYVRGEETVVVTLVGSHGKEGAKLLARDVKKKETPQPKKPAYLGVEVVPDAAGVRIVVVLPDCAAAAAGLRQGDVLVKANDQSLGDVSQLKALLDKLSAGDKVSLVVTRGSETLKMDVLLGAEGEKIAAPPKEAPKKPGKLGITGGQFRQGDSTLVQVTALSSGGAAEKAGIQLRDIIVKANQTDVRVLDDLTKLLGSLSAGQTVTLRVRRGNDEKDIPVVLGE